MRRTFSSRKVRFTPKADYQLLGLLCVSFRSARRSFLQVLFLLVVFPSQCQKGQEIRRMRRTSRETNNSGVQNGRDCSKRKSNNVNTAFCYFCYCTVSSFPSHPPLRLSCVPCVPRLLLGRLAQVTGPQRRTVGRE